MARSYFHVLAVLGSLVSRTVFLEAQKKLHQKHRKLRVVPVIIIIMILIVAVVVINEEAQSD